MIAANVAKLSGAGALSAFGTKRTSELTPPMSAFGGKADMDQHDAEVRF